MRPWAEELLNESRLRQEGYLSGPEIQQKWVEHLAGRHNWQAQLWGVLMFQTWLERHKTFVSSKPDVTPFPDARILGVSSDAVDVASIHRSASGSCGGRGLAETTESSGQ